MNNNYAPGGPGVKAKWTSGAKAGIGKSIDSSSNVAFTISHGILNEIYYPREDNACIRDMEFLVADEKNFFSEEKRDTVHSIKTVSRGVPCFKVINTCVQKKYRITKEIICDPLRNTVLQNIHFKQAGKAPLKLYALLAPHLNNKGDSNYGWVGKYKGVPMLFAQHDGLSLAMACSANWVKRSVGYVGTSDGWTDLTRHKKMTWEYTNTDAGNIALTGQINISNNTNFLVAISFGSNPAEAASHALGSLLEGFEAAKKLYIKNWDRWIKSLHRLEGKIFRESAGVLRMHESKIFPGGIIASLSIPWGATKDDSDKGGYHVVWPRDLVETAGGFLALRSYDDALRILNYLMSTQREDGSWSQNMWLEGTPHWKGFQMDQIALPLLLMDKCMKYNTIDKDRMHRYWPIIKRAMCYLIANGPYTQQDRWEEEKGYTPFTIATEIAALLVAADIAELNNEKELATYCRETADCWNANIENWLYVTGTDLAKQYNVDGYYIRINPFYDVPAAQLKDETIKLKNQKDKNAEMLLTDLICVDALALVRFGLRAADDPKILNTVKLIDAKLKIETPNGSCWHRYVNDGYGEYANGDPYDTAGVGRAWPLLTGERAHYEVAAGNLIEAKKLILAMDNFSNDNGFLPEQIWDADDIPKKELFFGKHTGSAMPLTWVHAEYIKLCTSLGNKKVFDMPGQAQERYIKNKTTSALHVWRFNNQCKTIKPDKTLRIEVLSNTIVYWTDNNWETINKIDSTDTGINLFVADIKHENKKAKQLEFTFYWIECNRWENKNFIVSIENAGY